MINIQDIIPFMKKGWVAMDEDGRWFWYSKKPHQDENFDGGYWTANDPKGTILPSQAFDIAPADDWTKSLIKVGGK